MNLRIRPLVLSLCLLLCGVDLRGWCQGTAFTYQGRLDDRGAAADGLYDLRFKLFLDPLGNTQVGNSQLTNGVPVTNGLFIVGLDFGPGIFGGSGYWLDIAVKTNSAASYTELSPLQKITASPYAIMAGSASNLLGTLPAAQLGGTLLPASLSGTYSNAVTFNNAANGFSGNGSGLANVNAATVGGLHASDFWQLGGNVNADPANGAFLGSADNLPLELRVNAMRALRLEPGGLTNGAPNLIAGSLLNSVAAGSVGATIGGGGGTNYYGNPAANSVSGSFGTVSGGVRNTAAGEATVGGGAGNAASYSDATVGGGLVNTASGSIATVGGGWSNTAGGSQATVGGGFANDATADYTTVGGGYNNRATFISATINGGYQNTASGDSAAIGGGAYNHASTNGAAVGGGAVNAALGYGSTVAGGYWNNASGIYASIGGGTNNAAGGDRAAIGGGDNNQASGGDASISGGGGNQASGFSAAVGGGLVNRASGESSVVSGGFGNVASGLRSMIPGGDNNQASGDYSLAAGLFAQAQHHGAFVWADASTDNAFSSTASNQFLIRATGGVGIGTPAPDSALSIQAGGASGDWISFQDSTDTTRWFIFGLGGGFGITQPGPASGGLYLSPNGNAGLGTSSPSAPLHIMGAGGNNLLLQDIQDGLYWRIYTEYCPGCAEGSGNLLFTADTGVFGYLRRSDGAFVSGSDLRLKRDVSPLDGVLERLLQLRPVSYRFRAAAEGTPRSLGLIAQEVEPLFPEVVDEHEGMKSLAYTELIPVTIRAIQELSQRLSEKEATLERLEAKNEALEQRLEQLERAITQSSKGR